MDFQFPNKMSRNITRTCGTKTRKTDPQTTFLFLRQSLWQGYRTRGTLYESCKSSWPILELLAIGCAVYCLEHACVQHYLSNIVVHKSMFEITCTTNLMWNFTFFIIYIRSFSPKFQILPSSWISHEKLIFLLHKMATSSRINNNKKPNPTFYCDKLTFFIFYFNRYRWKLDSGCLSWADCPLMGVTDWNQHHHEQLNLRDHSLVYK